MMDFEYNFDTDRQWCFFCWAPVGRRLSIDVEFDGAVIRNFHVPVCRRCFDERTRLPEWYNLEQREKIDPREVAAI